MSKFKVEAENRKNRYYNLYDYRAVIHINDIERFRYHNSYDEYIYYVRSWQGGANPPLANKDQIDRYFDYKNTVPYDCKIRLEANKIVVYANDLAHLDYAVDQIVPTGTVRYCKVNSPKEVGTIEFTREPKYKFRNYFKGRVVTAEVRKMFLDFITDQHSFGTEVTYNEAMMTWLKRPSRHRLGGGYLHESYYVEYNDENLEALFSLMFGEYLHAKTFKLVKRTKW